MIVVSDSTPLMHFGKIDRLNLLQLGYDEIVITQAVYRETVTEGLNMGEKDAILIKKAVGEWIRVLDPNGDSADICNKYKIHRGEADSILLAKQLNADLLLINERDGREAAKSCGINVKGTIGIIFDCVKKQIITKIDAIGILMEFKNNPSEYWIDPKIIDMAIDQLN